MTRRKPIPNKLGGRAQSDIFAPLTAGLVALRMGRAASEHYHDLAGALLIGSFVVDLVPRHRPLAPEIGAGMEALNKIFQRHAQRTIKDAPYSGTIEEIDAIDLAIEVYRGLVRTTPGPVLRRAILRATDVAVAVPANGDNHGSAQ